MGWRIKWGQGGTLKKLLRSIAQLSFLLQLTLLGLVVGIAFIFIESYRSGYILLAFGSVLVSLALAVTTYKSHTAAAEMRQVRLEVVALRCEVADQKQKRKQQQKQKQKPTPNSSSKQASSLPHSRIMRALDRSEKQQRMRAIGLYTPRVVDPSAKGRQAAAVEPDANRSYRLYAATEGVLNELNSDNSRAPKRKIAVIGTEPLRSVLEDEFALTVLRPGMAEAQLEADTPVGLVIEEAALQSGAWASALSASGMALLKEIIAVRDKTAAGAHQVYVIPSNTIDVSTRLLRERATVVVDRSYGQAFMDTRHETEDEGQTGSIFALLVHYLAI